MARRKGLTAQRRRDFYYGRIEAAVSPPERMSRAFDYLRALLAKASEDDVERIATSMTSHILQTADTIRIGARR